MTAFQFTPFPNLFTDRLRLRQLAMNDDHEILFLRSDERVLKYLSIPKSNTIDDARAFIDRIKANVANNESIYWAISLKEDNKLIGTICLWNIVPDENRAEIGYVLHPDWQGQGLMLEAVTSVVSYGFEKMKLQLIEAFFHPDNLRSVSLLKRAGFIFEKKEKDMVVYSIKSAVQKQSPK